MILHVLHKVAIDRYFSGALGPRAVQPMLDRLWSCADCRARYERHLRIERVLPSGDARGVGRLWASIVGSAEAAAVVPVPPLPARRAALLVASLALAALVLIPWWPKAPPRVDPVPRGAAVEPAPAPALYLYRTRAGHAEPVEGEITRDDGLLIAYSNPTAELGYLMVFAVDERGGIHWYYPAYGRLGEDPAAVPIRTKAMGVELGEEIRHPIPEGDLRMFALFLPGPRHVLEIEAMLAQALAAHGGSVRALSSLPVGDGRQTTSLLDVRP